AVPGRRADRAARLAVRFAVAGAVPAQRAPAFASPRAQLRRLLPQERWLGPCPGVRPDPGATGAALPRAGAPGLPPGCAGGGSNRRRPAAGDGLDLAPPRDPRGGQGAAGPAAGERGGGAAAAGASGARLAAVAAPARPAAAELPHPLPQPAGGRSAV